MLVHDLLVDQTAGRVRVRVSVSVSVRVSVRAESWG